MAKFKNKEEDDKIRGGWDDDKYEEKNAIIKLWIYEFL